MAKKHSFVGVLIALAVSCHAHAVLVLDGKLTSQTLIAGGGAFSALGPVTTSIDIDLELDIPFGPGPIGVIGPGSTVVFSSGVATVADGIVTVKDDGTKDMVEFIINVNNLSGFSGTTTDGQITFSFMGDLVSSEAIDSSLFGSLSTAEASISYVDYSNTQLSHYRGVVAGVTAVPEASSMACIGLVALGFVAWRQRSSILPRKSHSSE